MSVEDPHDLRRFVEAQAPIYAQALSEVRQGRKRSHWMWFVFPQIDGLGFSPMARHYAIKNLDEARAFLAHPILGPRLLEISNVALAVSERSAHEIFGSPDDLKLRSCATLFARTAGTDSVFQRLLEKYYGGEPDPETLRVLAMSAR